MGWINGGDAGIAWSIPVRLPISRFLDQGKNILKIEVADLIASVRKKTHVF